MAAFVVAAGLGLIPEDENKKIQTSYSLALMFASVVYGIGYLSNNERALRVGVASSAIQVAIEHNRQP